MTFLGACTRRLLYSERVRVSARLFQRPGLRINSFIPSTLPFHRNHSTIYKKLKKPRFNYNDEGFTKFANKLVYVLRCVTGREHGFENREDEYVSVKLLLSHPEFQNISMPTLQKFIDSDPKHRFGLQFDPTKREDCWWIRARKLNEPYFYLKPIKPGIKTISHAVYRTTIQEWNHHISRNGIPRLDAKYIQLECGIFTENYLNDLENIDEVFVFVDIEACMNEGIRFFTPTPPPQPLAKPTHLVTKGNQYGFITPDFFVEADRVQIKKTLLWGDSDPLMKQSALSPEEQEKYRNRPMLLPALPQNLAGFVDIPFIHRPHPKTVEEAKALLATP